MDIICKTEKTDLCEASYYSKDPVQVKNEITIEEIKIEPEIEDLNFENYSYSDEKTKIEPETEDLHFYSDEEFNIILQQIEQVNRPNIQSKSRANLRKVFITNEGPNVLNNAKKRRRKSGKNINDPKYHKPFLYGWTREVVFRRRKLFYKRNDTNLDVYYYMQTKKFRSSVEISNYLKAIGDKNLTVDDFLFSKILLGLDRKYENTRLAKPIRNKKECSNQLLAEVVANGRKSVAKIHSLRDTFKEKFVEKYEKSTPVTNLNDIARAKNLEHYTQDALKPFCAPSGARTGRDAPKPVSYVGKKRFQVKGKYKQNMKDPKFLKPFLYGWKREVVHRMVRSCSYKSMDIYYYSKTGDKFRSTVEITQYLKKSMCKTLTKENFTFAQAAIGLTDDTEEIIRFADGSKVSKYSKNKGRTKIQKNMK